MPKSPIKPSLFRFLKDLKKNNNRDWFHENKARYRSDVLEPAVELVAQLEKPLSKAAPMLGVIPKAHGGSVLRIYRDTRFSKDKTPYKTNVGISVRHQADDNIHAPGIYIQLDTERNLVGAGCWRPHRETLGDIRAAIDEDPAAWKRVRKSKTFNANYELIGESLKTAPRGFAKDHPLIEDLRRTDYMGVAMLTQKDFCSDDVVDVLIDRIKKAKPLMRFLCDAIDVPY